MWSVGVLPKVIYAKYYKHLSYALAHETTVHPNKIVARRGPTPPSVDYEESDKKDKQICISILGHSYNA